MYIRIYEQHVVWFNRGTRLTGELFTPHLFPGFDAQEVMAFPENQPYEFRLLAGETIRLEPDGSFYVDGQKCSGDTFLGVSGC